MFLFEYFRMWCELQILEDQRSLIYGVFLKLLNGMKSSHIFSRFSTHFLKERKTFEFSFPKHL